MSYLKVNQDRIDEKTAALLQEICPFQAFTYQSGRLEINAACKMCRLCVKNGPPGAVEYIEERKKEIDKEAWKGIAVYIEHDRGTIHDVSLELLGEAKRLASVRNEPVYGILIGNCLSDIAKKLCLFGLDAVYVYDDEILEKFKIDVYTNALCSFIDKMRPSAILVGATMKGRSLAPRAAARCKTGLTADCTKLQMKKNGDLVQIRPAFGGNIMAQIITPAHRPQFCTVRYKVFPKPEPSTVPEGRVEFLKLTEEDLKSEIQLLEILEKPKESDIADADIIVACGRGFKTKEDLKMAGRLAELLGGSLAGTRPTIEAGWFSPRQQIGLSGRTVKPKIIITLGVSGFVQFTAGMQNSDCIIAVNSDPEAQIFHVAHYGVCADLYEFLPAAIAKLEGGRA